MVGLAIPSTVKIARVPVGGQWWWHKMPNVVSSSVGRLVSSVLALVSSRLVSGIVWRYMRANSERERDIESS